MSILIPVSQLRSSFDSFIASAWPEVTTVLYERQADKLPLDKAGSPLAAVVWGEPSAQRYWSPEVGTYGYPIDVYYLAQFEDPGAQEEAMQAKAQDLINALTEAGNRWAGVEAMHSWRLRSGSTRHDRADVWRASGWAGARVALEALFDYER